MCFSKGVHVDSSHCDANERPDVYEDCNNQPCDEGGKHVLISHKLHLILVACVCL